MLLRPLPSVILSSVIRRFVTLRPAIVFAILFLVRVGSVSAQAAAPSDDWTEWRGPQGQGHAFASDLPTEWNDGENVVWQIKPPGQGWSTPVVSGNQIWMTAAVESEPTEDDAARAAKADAGQPLKISGTISLRAICVDWQTGELIHDVEVLSEPEPQPIHSLNSYASPSPILEAGKLYCHFGSHGTACLDTASATVDWTNQSIQVNHENGPGSTPVLWNNRLIVHFDGSDRQLIVAFDTATGNIAWQTERSGEMNSNPQLKKAYGTPIVIERGGIEELLSPAADWLYAYDPETGKELWKLSYEVLGFSIVPRPVFGNGKVYLSTSFMQPELLAIDVAATEPHILWRSKKQAPTMASPLLVDSHLYMVSERGIASCLDAETGQTFWTERLGGNFSSSPLVADGKLFFGNRDGEMFVLAPGDDFKLLSTNRMDGAIMASPIALRNSLIIRTESSLYRISKSSMP